MAALLAKQFGEPAVLYDKYHKAEFARDDLAFYLPPLYHDESDLIVGVFCPDYDKKEWCGLEYKAIFDLIKTGRSKTSCSPGSGTSRSAACTPSLAS